MKYLFYIVLFTSIAACSDGSSANYEYYSYESETGDTILNLHAKNQSTDSAYLILSVPENLYNSDNISIHFCMSDITISNFKSKHFEPAYKVLDSIDMPEQYYFLFDAKNLGIGFYADTAVIVTIKSKSSKTFQTTLEHKQQSGSWDLPVVKTCMLDADRKKQVVI